MDYFDKLTIKAIESDIKLSCTFEHLISNEHSTWKEDSEWRIRNRYWLKYSQKITLLIFNKLKERLILKDDLQQYLRTNDSDFKLLLEGQYNYDLLTIIKLEELFDIKIINI